MLLKCPELLSSMDGDKGIQEKFIKARSLQPCVVYLEGLALLLLLLCMGGKPFLKPSPPLEFESIAHLGSEYSTRIVAQMAVCLDEISCSEKVFVMAATNRPDLIEPVLLRPGRFDQLIYVPLPNEVGRQEILMNALSKAPLAEDVKVGELAIKMEGLSGADLLEVCKRACKFAIRESISNAQTETFRVGMAHFDRALKGAKRSVAESDLYRYDHFNNVLRQISNPSLMERGSGASAAVVHRK